MVPRAGESPGQWWEATGQKQAMIDYFQRIGLGDKDFDMVEDFFHDVPDDVRAEAMSQPEPAQSDTPVRTAVAAWTAGPTCRPGSSRAATTAVPLEFQRRVVRDGSASTST